VKNAIKSGEIKRAGASLNSSWKAMLKANNQSHACKTHDKSQALKHWRISAREDVNLNPQKRIRNQFRL
jgi:hypothetical protein